ncbi:hypothetical protein HK18_08900 [Commensalibacter intestini]|uniref:Lipoprotein n=1 Tax=Commensalibacter intestini TaxID=479936 RepID=A0A251ZU31_9PROT|nr:hypothetical protein [Commensalibacter intestini]OUI78161.1 hypothetical protein HK18_08900 [Commensalibacter intestini]
MWKFISIGCLILLCSCTKTNFISLCPEPVKYSQESQQKLQQELMNIPEDSHIVQYLIDYKKQRDMLSACHQE